MQITLKECFICKNQKNILSFRPVQNTNSPDKRSPICDDCGEIITPAERTAAIVRHWRHNNIEKAHKTYRDRYIKNVYKITVEEYDQMLTDQGGVCAICKSPSMTIHQSGRTRKLAVDHNHATGKIRGLLCRGCNHAIGWFKDDTAIIERALVYVTAGEVGSSK